MHLLVVGANGLLGSNIVFSGNQQNWEISGTFHSVSPNFNIYLKQFDLSKYWAFSHLLEKIEPDIVINCAAMTDVEECENNPKKAHIVNGVAPGAMAKECHKRDIRFVQVSTDYVFDGVKREKYVETDEMNPIQIYGKSKLLGENAVISSSDSALIVRLSFVWGLHKSNKSFTGFPAWIRNRINSMEEVPLYTDQWVTPARAGQTANTLIELIDNGAIGLYHVACKNCVTPYQFGKIFTEYLGNGMDLLVESSLDKVDTVASRPSHTCLNVGKLESYIQRSQPTLREDIDSVQYLL